MKKSDQDYLRDLLHYIERIKVATKDGKDRYLSDFIIQDAVIRQYEVIGEIVKRITPALIDSQPMIQWKNIKGFRDYLAHNYDRVDLEIIWRAVEDLPSLHQAVQSLLDALENEQPSDEDTK